MTNFSPTQLLTVKDVAELLQISKNQAYTLVHSKDFPMCKINGSIRVSVPAINQWVKPHTQRPNTRYLANPSFPNAQQAISQLIIQPICRFASAYKKSLSGYIREH